ncbi:hypothetical protein CABS03_01528 [Colletotrichum abscissum]|uniref:Xylanolytic transcriptional activator regulatory domain-containing protein n=2 Tax=Colletotrichum abscissum TaxID=1671311 RepID=A0A9P9XEQ5_9PEZI|nr:hypothetical protein CABS02_07357 [Colletotrichum abscissum]
MITPNEQNQSLQGHTGPSNELSSEGSLPSVNADGPNVLGDIPQFGCDIMSEVENFDFSDISLEFFDPFLGRTFDHFAFPVLEDVPEQLQPPVPSLPQSKPSGYQSNPSDRGEEIPTLSQGHTISQGALRPRRRWSPRILKSTTAKNHKVVFTEEMRAHCLADIELHLTKAQLGDFQLPPVACLQQYFNSYVDAFHIHFPFLHLQTLELEKVPSPLVLGICAIGALHRLQRKMASSLYLTAERVLASIDFERLQAIPELLDDWARPRDSPPPDQGPLVLAQTRFILVFFASFSSEPRLIRQALVGCGHLSADFRSRMARAKPGSMKLNLSQWHSWVEHESIKRLMCCCMVLGNLLVIAYGIVPGFAALEECNIEMPAEDELWDAMSASEWRSSLQRRLPSSPLGLRQATAWIFGNSAQEERLDASWTWSPFAASIVMHQVAIVVWFFAHGKEACYGTTQSYRESHQSDAKRIEAALSRCRDLLTETRDGNDGTWTEADGPLLFNAFAVLRVSYGRAFINFQSLDRSLLFQESSQDMLIILQRYFDAAQERDGYMTMAVDCALEGFAIPIRAGVLLTQKTAALKWSVEHALAGWDAALLVTKWVHTVECLQSTSGKTTPEETKVLDNVRYLLSQIDVDRSPSCSLAADLARVWAGLYDDTWVWGVAPRIS